MGPVIRANVASRRGFGAAKIKDYNSVYDVLWARLLRAVETLKSRITIAFMTSRRGFGAAKIKDYNSV